MVPQETETIVDDHHGDVVKVDDAFGRADLGQVMGGNLSRVSRLERLSSKPSLPSMLLIVMKIVSLLSSLVAMMLIVPASRSSRARGW